MQSPPFDSLRSKVAQHHAELEEAAVEAAAKQPVDKIEEFLTRAIEDSERELAREAEIEAEFKRLTAPIPFRDESEPPSKTNSKRGLKIPNWLRWIAVLPAFLSTMALANVIIALVNFLEVAFLVELFNSVMSPLIALAVACWVAPSFNKMPVAITLTAFYCICAAALVAFVWVEPSRFFNAPWWVTICYIVSVCGMIGGCRSYRGESP